MSDFVNYHKRSVDLPGGCKDLADVLQQGQSPLRPEVNCTKLCYIYGHLARAWESKAKFVFLSIGPQAPVSPEAGLLLNVNRGIEARLQARFEAQLGSVTGLALCRFLQNHGYRVPDDSVPKQFSRQLPVQMICELSPLPGSAFELAALAIAIFREVCQLGDDSPMTFHYFEKEALK